MSTYSSKKNLNFLQMYLSKTRNFLVISISYFKLLFEIGEQPVVIFTPT